MDPRAHQNILIRRNSDINKLDGEETPNDAWSMFVARKEEAAVKVVVASVSWLHGVSSFMQLESQDQDVLMIGSWKELFLITAAQMMITFGEGTYCQTKSIT